MKRRLEFINSNNIILTMRLIKSDTEIELLKKSWQICDTGYSAVLNSNIVGLIEIQAAGIGEKAARDAGAESIIFSIFASGKRTNTVIGRPTEKIIESGDMIMLRLRRSLLKSNSPWNIHSKETRPMDNTGLDLALEMKKPRLWDVDSPRPRQVSFAPLPKYLLRRERI